MKIAAFIASALFLSHLSHNKTSAIRQLANHTECLVSGAVNRSLYLPFKAYVVNNTASHGLSEALCSDVLFGSRYSHAVVNWKHKSLVSSIDLFSNNYHILYIDEAHLRSHFPDYATKYAVLSGEKEEDLFLVSIQHSDSIRFNTSYGLLSDPLNYTGNIRPSMFLSNQLGRQALPNVTYYSNVDSMIRGLESGEVDYIPLTNRYDLSIYNTKLLIEKNVNYHQWYVSRELSPTIIEDVKNMVSSL
ncbi:hypothetical protein ACPV5S_09175 [Vibrio astriarenae]